MAPAARLTLLLVVLSSAAAGPALADEVILTTGGRLEGKAFREGSLVRIELDSGTVMVPAATVRRIIPGASPAEVRAARREARLRWVEDRMTVIGPDDPQGLFRVAQQARREGFPEAEVAALLGLVLGADPDHAGARAELGEVRYRDRWVLRDEARRLAERDHAEAMRSRGFVRFEGEWMKPAEVDWREVEDDWRRALASMESERDDLEAERDDTADALYRLENQAGDLAGRLAAAEADLDFYRAEAERLEDERYALECEVARLDGALGLCHGRLFACEGALGECQSELAARPPHGNGE